MDFLLEMQSEGRNNKFDLADKVGERGSGMLIGVDFNHHFALKAHIGNFTIADSCFTSFNSMDTTYESCRLLDSQFVDSDFVYTKFQNCYFKNLNFDGCSFRYTAFEGCTFDNCSFASVQPIAETDEVVFKSCVIFYSEDGFGEILANRSIVFEGSLLDSKSAPKAWIESGDNVLRQKKAELIKPSPLQIKMGKTKAAEKVETLAVAPSEPKTAAGGLATRFDKLEF